MQRTTTINFTNKPTGLQVDYVSLNMFVMTENNNKIYKIDMTTQTLQDTQLEIPQGNLINQITNDYSSLLSQYNNGVYIDEQRRKQIISSISNQFVQIYDFESDSITHLDLYKTSKTNFVIDQDGYQYYIDGENYLVILDLNNSSQLRRIPLPTTRPQKFLLINPNDNRPVIFFDNDNQYQYIIERNLYQQWNNDYIFHLNSSSEQQFFGENVVFTDNKGKLSIISPTQTNRTVLVSDDYSNQSQMVVNETDGFIYYYNGSKLYIIEKDTLLITQIIDFVEPILFVEYDEYHNFLFVQLEYNVHIYQLKQSDNIYEFVESINISPSSYRKMIQDRVNSRLYILNYENKYVTIFDYQEKLNISYNLERTQTEWLGIQFTDTLHVTVTSKEGLPINQQRVKQTIYGNQVLLDDNNNEITYLEKQTDVTGTVDYIIKVTGQGRYSIKLEQEK